MFDAKKLLDAMVTGASEASTPAKSSIGDALGQVLSQVQQKAGQAGEQAKGAAGTLGGIARQVAGEVQRKAAEPGGLAGLAKQVLGQATAGVKDAAQRVDSATGAGAKLDGLVKQVSGGKGSAELLDKVKELVGKNPAAAAALAGALGALVLGTRTGRSLTVDAAKLGGLVLIGGLAYKAYQNHQSGKPVLGGEAAPTAAPAGSGYEAGAQTDDSALLYVRAMIAAAAADGVIDEAERTRIVGGLAEVGLDPAAASFLEAEFARPASVAELAAGARTPEIAAQVYTAARLAIEPDSAQERAFLADLATALHIDPKLAEHIDAVASDVKT